MDTYQILKLIDEVNIYKILHPEDKRSREELVKMAKSNLEYKNVQS